MKHTHPAIFEIKAAFRDLVSEAGGQSRAAGLTAMPQTKISEAGSINHPERGPRVDHVAILEADTGSHRITRLLAELAGSRLVLNAEPAAVQDPHVHLARIIRETGDVTARMAQALADGRMSKPEARTLKQEAEEAIQTLHAFIDSMNAVLLGGGA